MMEENPIIEEIRRTRDAILAKHYGDLDSLVDELQRRSKERKADEPQMKNASEFGKAGQTEPTKKVG